MQSWKWLNYGRDFDILATLEGKWIGTNGSEYDLVIWKEGKSINVWTKYKHGGTRYTRALIRVDSSALGPYGVRWGSSFFLAKCNFSSDSLMCVSLVWKHYTNPNQIFCWSRDADRMERFDASNGRSIVRRLQWQAEDDPHNADIDELEAIGSWGNCATNSLEISGPKLEPQILYESAHAQVLNKGPLWICSFNSHGTKTYQPSWKASTFDKKNDKRSCLEVVNSRVSEHLDVYVAKKFQDEMVWEWWKRKHEYCSSSGAGFVHRLDVLTSGCILRAKTAWSFERLLYQIRRGWVRKVYTCLVHGIIQPNCVHVLVSNLTYDAVARRSVVFNESWDGRAETWVRCRQHLRGKCDNFGNCNPYSLCDVQILTGRTHQIRAHMSLTGTPVVSDGKYNRALAWEDEEWCPRTFLHARLLRFWDGDEEVCVEAPLPYDLCNALESLHLEADYGGSLTDDFDAYMSFGKQQTSRVPDEPLSEKTSSDLLSLEAALLENIIEAMNTSGGKVSLETLSKNINIRYKLRKLQCGGPDAKDIYRLKAFIQDRCTLFDLNEHDGTLSYHENVDSDD